MAHPYDDRYRDEHRSERGHGREDRGFFERAGDEVRSWFGDDDADRRRRYEEERARRERMTSERGWTGGERPQGADRWRDDSERWRAESERWFPEPIRGRGDYRQPDYGRSPRAWNEPGYGRSPEDRPPQEDRWRAGEGSRDYGERWRSESGGGMWGPATWSQSDRWRREGGGSPGDRLSRESNWGAWPREGGSSANRGRTGESRGYYEDDRGMTHQFSHSETHQPGRAMGTGMNYAGRSPKNYRRSDERIREEICERLTDDWRVDPSDMEVTVHDGQVTLSGSVHSREEKRKAEDLVEAVPGVHDVTNNLRVSQWDDNRYGDSTSMGSGNMQAGGTNAGTGTSTPSSESNTTTSNTRR